MAGSGAVRRIWRAAPASWGLAALTSAVWLIALVTGWSGALALHAGFLPERLADQQLGTTLLPAWITPLSTIFAHAGFLHLALNMGALLTFGRAVEPAVGIVGILSLYVFGAIAAAAAFFLVHPIGMLWLGAGGSVGAVLGAYAMLYGRKRSAGRSRMTPWAYAAWLCAGWTLLSMLVSYTYADYWAFYFAPAFIASFAAGLPLGRLLLLFRYRKA